MHHGKLDRWQHSHAFGQDVRRLGERRTLIVIAITGATMVVEVVAGILFGSMALLADGLHMASHAAALTINAFAYVYARRHAHDTDFSFGTGKVNALGGFSGAILLVLFSLLMAGESVARLIKPVDIIFDQAIAVALLGLIVNGISVLVLRVHDPHHRHEEHASHDGHAQQDHDDHHDHRDPLALHPGDRADHNLRSAYLHVLADALTSILAIAALLAAKYLGAIWMDAVMGVLGAILVARWSLGLLRATSGVLLDRQGPDSIRRKIAESIEADQDSKVADLHLWSIGPNVSAVVMAVVAHEPATPEQYKARIPTNLGLGHVSIEVHRCESAAIEVSPRDPLEQCQGRV